MQTKAPNKCRIKNKSTRRNLPSGITECCRFQCELRGIRCTKKVISEYLDYVQAKADACNEHWDESEPTDGFHAASETSESAIPIMSEEDTTNDADTSQSSVFAFTSPAKSTSEQSQTSNLPVFSFQGMSSGIAKEGLHSQVSEAASDTPKEVECTEKDCECSSKTHQKCRINNKSTRRNLRRREAKKNTKTRELDEDAVMSKGEIE